MIPNNPKKQQNLVLAIGLSSQLVFSVLICFFIGKKIGETMQWEPFGSLGGAMLGFLIGTISFLRLEQIKKKK